MRFLFGERQANSEAGLGSPSGRAGTASAVTERSSRVRGPLFAPVRVTSAPLLMGEARALSEFPAATAPHPSRPYGRATFSQEKALRFLMNYILLSLLTSPENPLDNPSLFRL